MNTGAKNIYRLEKHDWIPLLSFNGGQARAGYESTSGWHNGSPYNAPNVRTMGVRYIDPNGVVQSNKVAYRGSYVSYNTNTDWTMDVKYDVSKLTALWYRYKNVGQILVPFSEMPELRVLSIRDHDANLGDMDLTNNPKFSHLDLSNYFGRPAIPYGNVTSITFHPDAPLKFVYLSDCNMTQQVVDECLRQCWRSRDITAPDGIQDSRSFLSQRMNHSNTTELNNMKNELINDYGWTGFTSF